MYRHSRQGGLGVCEGISIGLESPATSKWVISPFPQNHFEFKTKTSVIPEVQTQLFPIDCKCPRCFEKKP